MDNFSYLSVLISIVLGLGITNLLTGLAALMRHRSRVRVYWPTPVWMITLFLIHLQTWWAMFGLRSVGHWNFAAFLIVLLQPVALFVMTALIAPDVAQSDPVNLRAAYFRESRWFLGALVFALCASLAKDLVLSGKFPETPNLAAHIVFIGVALFGIAFQNDRVHKILAPLGLIFIAFYISLLFMTLS